VREDADLEVWDKTKSRSIYNLVTEQMRKLMDELPKEYLVMSPNDIEKMADPDIRLAQIQVGFWSEYHRCQYAGNHKMVMSNVYNHVCAGSYFWQRICANPVKLAYILNPPNDYRLGMEAILSEGLKVMYRAMRANNIINEQGNIVDAKNLEAILKIVDKTIVAIHGMPVMRHETKALNVNVNQQPVQPERSIKDLENELRELKAKREKQLGPSTLEPIEIMENTREAIKSSGE